MKSLVARGVSFVLAFGFVLTASVASAQNDGPTITGLFPNRDYLSLLPFESIDTSSSNVILHFDDLV